MMEVRCCCRPQKVLGWLPVGPDVREGDTIQFVVRPARWALASLNEPPVYEPLDRIALPVAVFVIDRAFAEPIIGLALKSEETQIERLRLIRGFRVNNLIDFEGSAL
jgi:hypothetical protein